MPDKTINEEAGLPENWVPVDVPPVIPSRPALNPNTLDGSSRYLQGSLPADIQHDTSFTDTAYQGAGVPRLSLMPLSVQGSPVVNAGIQSTSKTTIENPSQTTIINEQGITGIVPIASGGTGTANPNLVAGANIVITGAWPNQTISATAGGAVISFTSASQANISMVPVSMFTTVIDGFWVFEASVTSSAKTDGSGGTPSITVNLPPADSVPISFNGEPTPFTLTVGWSATITNTTPPVFIPAGQPVQVGTTLTLAGGALLTYTVTVKSKML